jgi:Bacterial Ig-like domain (group 3)/FG-GAP-like repeat
MRHLRHLPLVLCIGFTLASLAQSNPVPFLSKPLVPSAMPAGSQSFVLTVNGSNFVSGSIVTWNGISLPTTFVSAARLTASVAADQAASNQTVTVKVLNPPPGGGSSSNAALFTITNPTATLAFASSTLSTIQSSITVLAGDFNNDGKADLAVINQAPAPACNYQYHGVGSIVILLGNGDGTFTPKSTLCFPDLLGTTPQPIALAADYNADGNLDLIATSLSVDNDAISVYYGAGDGTFTGPFAVFNFSPVKLHGLGQTTSATPTFIYGLDVGDFDGQGQVGMLVAFLDTNGSNSVVLLPDERGVAGGGNATFAIGPLAAGDFNADGKLDFAMSGTPALTAFLNNGGGTFTQVPGQPATDSDTGVSTGDFNGDGILDIASSSSMLLGNGDGTFRLRNGSPGAGLAADFNGDGKLDLTVGNYVYLGKGNGSFQSGIALPANAQTFADFNGDGRIDLATANSDGTISIILQVPIQTTIAVSSSLPTSVFGEAVTFKAVMTPHGFGSPTGIVTLTDNGVSLGSAPLSSGVATFTTRLLTPGTHQIVAQYGGDANYLPSTSGLLTQIVDKASTDCEINATAVYVQKELRYRLTSRVSSATSPPALPTGDIKYWDSTYSEVFLGQAPLLGGKASLTVLLDPEPNPQWVKADYAGDDNFNGCESRYFTIFQ